MRESERRMLHPVGLSFTGYNARDVWQKGILEKAIGSTDRTKLTVVFHGRRCFAAKLRNSVKHNANAIR
jgi:hypothetical protein